MALKVTRGHDLPTGAIRLDRTQAITFQQNRLESLSSDKNVWFLKYGTYLLGAGTAVTSFTILNFFWWRLRIGKNLRITSYIPTICIPTTTAFIVSEKYVREPIMIQEFTCPVCAEITATAFQMAYMGQAYFMSLFSSIAAATQCYTYPIPDFKIQKPTKYFNFVKKLAAESKSRILPVLILNIVLSSFVTYELNKEILYINNLEEITAEEEFSD